MPIDPQVAVAFGSFVSKGMQRKRAALDPVSGTIDLVNNRVTLDRYTSGGGNPVSEKGLGLIFKGSRLVMQRALTNYLRGTGQITGGRVWGPIKNAIDAEVAMRLRPVTPIESVGYGSATPALQALRGNLFGSRRRPAARRRKRRAAAPRRARKRAPARARARRGARLVRGSAAAKAWGRKMRRLRRR